MAFVEMGRKEISTFTLNLALKMEEELGLEDVLYQEVVNACVDISKRQSRLNCKLTIASVKSIDIRDQLCLAAMRSNNFQVILYII